MARKRDDDEWLEGDALVDALKRELNGYEVGPNEPPRRTPQYTLRKPTQTSRRGKRGKTNATKRNEPPKGQRSLW